MTDSGTERRAESAPASTIGFNYSSKPGVVFHRFHCTGKSRLWFLTALLFSFTPNLICFSFTPIAGEKALQLKPDEDIASRLKLGDEFSFVVIGHVRANKNQSINEAFSIAMTAIESIDPDFIVFTGDVTWGDWNNALERVLDEWRMFTEFLERFRIPYFLVPGNHEITNRRSAKRYQEYFGPTNGFLQINRFRFVFLDTTAFGTADTYGLPIEQIPLLTGETEVGEDTFVFMHHPLWMKLKHLEEPYRFKEQFLFAGNSNDFQYSLTGDGKIQILNGLDSWPGGESPNPISFTLVSIRIEKIQLNHVSVSTTDRKLRFRKIYPN